MKAYAAAEATVEKRIIARVVISDARNRGLRRGPGLERNATAWAYLRASTAWADASFFLGHGILVCYPPLAAFLGASVLRRD